MGTHSEKARFPRAEGGLTRNNEGMTLREHYAGLAAQGFAVHMTKSYVIQSPSDIAKYAVEVADAIIAELAKTKGRT